MIASDGVPIFSQAKEVKDKEELIAIWKRKGSSQVKILILKASPRIEHLELRTEAIWKQWDLPDLENKLLASPSVNIERAIGGEYAGLRITVLSSSFFSFISFLCS